MILFILGGIAIVGGIIFNIATLKRTWDNFCDPAQGLDMVISIPIGCGGMLIGIIFILLGWIWRLH